MDLNLIQSPQKPVQEVNLPSDCYLKERASKNQRNAQQKTEKPQNTQRKFKKHRTLGKFNPLFYDYSKAIIIKGKKLESSSNLKSVNRSQSQLPQGIKANRIRLAIKHPATRLSNTPSTFYSHTTSDQFNNG